MPTDDELALMRRRRAWLLLAARQTDARKPTLEDVAVAVGLKPKSASSVSDWEHNISAPSTEKLHRLAAYYGVPVRVFTEPVDRPTDAELLDDWRAELARAAIGLAHQDLAGEGEEGPAGDARPSAQRGRRSA